MQALVAAAGVYRSRPASDKRKPSVEEKVGRSLLDSEGYLSLVEEFSASRSSRKILPGLQASVAAADKVSCGSKDHVDRLVEIVKQAHVVYDNLRRGEGEVLTSSIQMQLHKCWDGFDKLPCREGYL